MSDQANGLTYAEAGVDIDAGEALVEAIKPLARATARPGADASLGGFGALFDLKAAGYADPLLVATTGWRGHQAEDRHRDRPPRHSGRRPGGHVRQRPAGPGRGASDVPGLLRHRQAGRGRRTPGGGRDRRRVPARRLRSGRRRDRGNAWHVHRRRLRPGRLLGGGAGARAGAAAPRRPAAERPPDRAGLVRPALQRLFR